MQGILKQICNNANYKRDSFTSSLGPTPFFEECDNDRGGGGDFRKRGERSKDKVCVSHMQLAHTLLENRAGAVTTPILCSWGRQIVMMMKQMMIHTLLSEVVKGMLAHTPRKTVCDCTTVAGIDSHRLHRIAQPVVFNHDNRDTQHCCSFFSFWINTALRWEHISALVSPVLFCIFTLWPCISIVCMWVCMCVSVHL